MTEAAAGTGSLKPEAQGEIVDGWREAAGLTGAITRRKLSKEQAREMLAAMGIGTKECRTSN
jgi:hypothetical protein